MTATATHPGRITSPATDLGVAGTLYAVPQAVNEWVVLDDRVNMGTASERTDATGALLNGGLKVPIVAGLLWTLLFVPDGTGTADTLGTFNLNTSGVDIRALVPMAPIVVDASVIADIAAVLALGTTDDTIIASKVNDGASATTTALAALYALKPTNGARAVGKGELELNATDYGIVGDATTQDLTALNAAITAAVGFGSVTVYFPRPSGAAYSFATPLPNVSNVRIKGDGMGTLLRWTAGSMLAPTTALTLWTFEDIAIECTGTASHLIDLGTTGGLTFSRFIRCDLHPKVVTASILHMNSTGNLFDIDFTGCKLWRQVGHTVPAFDITTSVSGVNNIRFRGGWWHSQLCNSSPFFRAESTSATSYIGPLTFEGVIGEQNLGGLVHVYANNGCRIRQFTDYDAGASTYTDDLFKSAAGSGGLPSHHMDIDQAGTAGAAVFAVGKVHLSIASGNAHTIGAILNASVPGTMVVPGIGRVLRHDGGHARSLTTRTTTSSFLTQNDVLLGNGSSITLTLPDPTALLASGTVPAGREYTAKNIHTTPLTVVSAGTALIDGVASVVLRPQESARFVTDGTNWWSFGKPAAAYDWTVPTSQIRQNIGRRVTVNAALNPLVSGRLQLVAIELLAGDVVSAIRLFSGTTAAVTPTAQWFALYSGARVKLGVTADDTTTAWAASTSKQLTLAAPYTVTASGLYYAGICVVAATVPTLTGVVLLTADAADPPIMTGSADTALTTPATAPATAAALTSSPSLPKVSVS